MNINDTRTIKPTYFAWPHPAHADRQLQELTERFELRNYRGPISAIEIIDSSNSPTFQIRLQMQVVDVRTGDPVQLLVGGGHHAKVGDTLTADYFGRIVYERIRWATLHELDECFMIDGAHFHEPHPELSRELPVALKDGIRG